MQCHWMILMEKDVSLINKNINILFHMLNIIIFSWEDCREGFRPAKFFIYLIKVFFRGDNISNPFDHNLKFFGKNLRN